MGQTLVSQLAEPARSEVQTANPVRIHFVEIYGEAPDNELKSNSVTVLRLELPVPVYCQYRSQSIHPRRCSVTNLAFSFHSYLLKFRRRSYTSAIQVSSLALWFSKYWSIMNKAMTRIPSRLSSGRNKATSGNETTAGAGVTCITRSGHLVVSPRAGGGRKSTQPMPDSRLLASADLQS